MKIIDDWEIRPAKINDAGNMRELFLKGYQGGYPYISFLNVDSIVASINSDKTDVLVIEHDNKIVGTGTVVYSGHRAELGRAVIDPQYRGVLKTKEGKSAFSEVVRKRVSLALEHGAGIIHSTGVAGHARTQAALSKQDFKHLVYEYGKYFSLYKQNYREVSFEMVYGNSPLINDVFADGSRVISVHEFSENVIRRNLNELGVKAKIVNEYSGRKTADIISSTYDEISNHLLISVGQGTASINSVVDEILKLRKEHGTDYEMIKVSTVNDIATSIYNKLLPEGFYTSGFLPAWNDSGKSIDDAVVYSSLHSSFEINPEMYIIGNGHELKEVVEFEQAVDKCHGSVRKQGGVGFEEFYKNKPIKPSIGGGKK